MYVGIYSVDDFENLQKKVNMYRYVGLKDKVEMETRWWLSALPIVKTT